MANHEATWHTNRAREELERARHAPNERAATPHAALSAMHLAQARKLLAG